MSRLCIDRQLYVEQCQVVNKMLKDPKTACYSSIIAENASDPKSLFNTVDKLLHRKVERRYPSATSKTELVNNFINFFDNKIHSIRKELSSELISTTQSNMVEQPIFCAEFTDFKIVSQHEVENIIDAVIKKSCDLDPIPSSILKGCKMTLLPLLHNIINRSLQSSNVSTSLKEAMIKPKLKKRSLDVEEFASFRPLSNLKFVSKIIERQLRSIE